MIFALSFSIWQKNDYLGHDEAVVMKTVTSVKSSPSTDNSTDLFILHEGTKVTILETMGYVIENKESDNKRYYILFDKNFDSKTISPRVPKNFLTQNGYEEDTIPRICASSTIDGCLKGLSKNLKGVTLFVHTPITDETPYNPTLNEVPDSKITGEVWFKKSVKLKCIGKILVIKDDGKDGEKYTYGDRTAELYGWEYKWVEKYN
jgi:hypothetical protein